MATIQARIEAYIGSITSPTTALEDVMESERVFIIRNAPVSLIAGYATESVVTGDLNTITGDYRLFSVFNKDSETYATQTRPSSKFRDPDSLLYVTSESPKYAVEMDGVTVTALYPSTDQFAVRYARYDIPVSITSSSFTNIPPDAEEPIIYKACISELTFRQNTLIGSLSAALYSSPLFPSLTLDFTDVDTALSNDDFEKVDSILNKLKTQLSEYQLNLSKLDAELQDRVNIYTDAITRIVKQLETTIPERVNMQQMYQAELQKLGILQQQAQA
jgi:hypothetical protein